MKTIIFAVVTAVFLTTGTVYAASSSGDQPQALEDVTEPDTFDIPEDALRSRDPKLAAAMYQLGRKIATNAYRPSIRLQISVKRRSQGDWLFEQVARGVASIKKKRSCNSMNTPYFRITDGDPEIFVIQDLWIWPLDCAFNPRPREE